MKCCFQTLGRHAIAGFTELVLLVFISFVSLQEHQVGVEHAEETYDKFEGICSTSGGIKFVLLLNE